MSICDICDQLPQGFMFNRLENTLLDLNLSSCAATFTILNAINGCKRLQKLDINRNRSLITNMPDNFEFEDDIKESLEHLNINGCELTLPVFIEICKVENLKTLDIPNNPNIWPDEIEELPDIDNIKTHF